MMWTRAGRLSGTAALRGRLSIALCRSRARCGWLGRHISKEKRSHGDEGKQNNHGAFAAGYSSCFLLRPLGIA